MRFFTHPLRRTRKFRNGILAFAGLCLLPAMAFSQNVNVAGALVGNGSYGSLNLAFAAINAGAQTNATISVTIISTTTETSSAVLNAGAWTSLSIIPSGGARSVTGSINGPLVDLNGADRVLIDGLNTGGNSLSFDNSMVSATANTIRFINDARRNIVQNCTILGCGSTTASGNVVFSTSAGGGGNDSIGFISCTIADGAGGTPVNGVYATGTAGQENNTIAFTNCNIANFFSFSQPSCGILVTTGNTDWTISGCKFYQTASRSATVGNMHRAIQVTSGNNYAITGNTIGFASAAGAGVYTMSSAFATRFIAIDLAVGTTTASSVQGNTITAISLSTTASTATANGVLCGINVTGGNVNIGNVTPNVIGGASGAGLFTTITSAGTQGAVVGINCSSTGVVLIQNNVMGGFSSPGFSAAIAGGVAGINVTGVATLLTITGNTIGNVTANNMQAGTSGVTTGSSIASGINLSSTPTAATITNNTIQNFSSFGSGTGGYVRGIWTAAATGSSALNTITGNTINNLTTNSTLTTVTSGQACAVGINISIGNNDVVANNTISNVSMTNTGANTGFCVGITTGNATNTTISGNVIYGISNASTSVTTTAPGFAVGILIRSGTTAVNIHNNMISLGSGTTDQAAYIGILGNHGSTPDPICRIYHNTINITGTAAGGNVHPSFGYHRGDFTATSRTQTIDLRNNIITNTRTGGTGAHYAIGNGFNNATSSATGWAANASNYNILNAATATTVGYWSGAQTFAGWRTASASDANSYSAITVTYVNNVSNLHLNMGVTPTVIESGGTTIAGITTDIDGQVRPGPAGSVNGGAFLPDIGADEFDGVPIDALPPTITYTPLTFTCGFSDRTLTATIADLSGVPTAGILRPRVYYRKNAGPWFSSPGTLITGTATNGTWNFTIISSDMGGLVVSDVVSYFVIAQDIVVTPNITSNPAPGLVASDVNTVTTAPTTPNTYAISGFMSGTYTVGVSGTYATITQAVNAYNTSCLSGPVVFSLIDASYSAGETFPITINANPDASAVNTLTIKPLTGGTTITGSSATAIIKLNGADYVTIDGSINSTVNSICPTAVSATRDLIISNTSTAALSSVIWFSSTGAGAGATNNTVKNCSISNGVDQSTTATENHGIVSCGTTITAFPPSDGLDNNSNVIENNAIVRVCWGIYIRGGAASSNTGWIIRQNLIGPAAFGSNEIRKGGIILQNVSGSDVSGNEVRFVGNLISQTVGGTDHIGIGIGGADGPTPTVSNVTNTTVTKNSIHDIVCEKTFSAIGIMLAASNATASNNTIANNFIYNVRSNATSPDQGIGIDVTNGNGDKVLNNTVNMVTTDRDPGSATTATESDMCVRFQAGALNIAFQNNVLFIDEASNTASLKNFTVVAPAASYPWGTGVSNNNDYSINAVNTQNILFGLGTTGAAIPQVTTLVAWQGTFAPAQDAASLNVTPVFVSATDLHMEPNNNASLNNAGVMVSGVTDDIDCTPRSATPDIGADEFCMPGGTPTLSATNMTTCAGDATTLSVTAGALNESANWQWYSGSCGGTPVGTGTSISVSPTATTNYFVRGESGCAVNGNCANITITVNLLPVVTASPVAPTICDGASVTFTGGGATSYVWSGPELVGDNVPFTPTVNGTYTVTGTDGNGCSDTATAVLTINSLPVVTATPSSASVCDGSSLTLTGGGATSFTWNGPNAVTDNVPFVPTLGGTYTVTGTDANGCTDTATALVTINSLPTVSASASATTVCDGSSLTLMGGGASSYTWSGPETVTDNTPFNATIGGTYTVTGTDANSCSDTATIDITINALPTASYVELQTTTCINWSAITLTSGSPVGGTYSGPGVSGTSFDPATAGAGTWSVMYIYTDTNGCANSDSSMITVDLCTGIAAFANGSVNLFPNPSTGMITIDLGALQPGVTIRVMSTLGEVIREERTNDSRYELDLGFLANGVYYVQVQSVGNVQTLPVTIQK